MVFLGLGVLEKQHCRVQGWTTPDQFFHACYSDLPPLYESSGLAQGLVPYLDSREGSYLSQPVLTGLAMWAVAAVTPNGPDRDRWFFDLATVLIAGLTIGLVLLTVASAGQRRPWDAALLAVSPLLALSALVSLDLLGVTLATAGLLMWGRSRPMAAGLLLGLAIAARTYPLVLVVVLGLLALRAGRLGDWLMTAVTALVTALSVLAPWLVLNFDGARATYRTWSVGGAGYGSVWLLPKLLGEGDFRLLRQVGIGPVTLSPSAVTTLAMMGMTLAVLLGAFLALSAPSRPRVAQLAFVVLAIVVLTGKSWPVQTSLWLLPLAALARPRWRDHLVWMSGEVLYFVAVWLNIAGETTANRGLPNGWYAFLLVLRAACLLWLVWCVTKDMRHPERDVVRMPAGPWPTGDSDRVDLDRDSDDPLGGPLVGTDDDLVLQIR